MATRRTVSSFRSHVPASAARQSAYAEDWNAIHAPPTMEELRQEIDFYELRAREVLESDSPEKDWKYQLYRDHASHRRKLLAALRDGRPETWINYPD